MYCSECGKRAPGKFCWSCGAPLVANASEDGRQKEPDLKEPDLVDIDWTRLTNYEALLRVPEVRKRIAQHAAMCKAKFSGEQFLECCDKVLTPLTGGVPMTLIASIAQPISEKLGLKMSKTRSGRMPEPVGRIIVAVLCSLARSGQKLGQVVQVENGCTLHAAMPSDMWSLKGDLVVAVRAEGNLTLVEAGLTIPGQVYDWGKSQRALNQLFSDLTQLSQAA
jgi:hypothetical protein